MRVLAMILVACLAGVQNLLAQRSAPVARAFAGNDHRVHIVSVNGLEWIVAPEKGQDGIENIRIAEDARTVGWLTDLWDSCCVSYSIPTELVIWSDGRVIHRIHSGQAIFGWAFLDSGKEVAYHTAPLHGSEIYECERVDVRTARTLEHWWIGKSSPPPKWVKLLAQQFPMPDEDDTPSPQAQSGR